MGTASSRSRILKCATTVERQYGGDDSGMQHINAAIDGFCLFEKGDPVTMEVNMVDNQALRGAFTRGKRTASYRMYKWAGKVYFNKLSTGGINSGIIDPYDPNEYTSLVTTRTQDRSWGPLWRSCGLSADYTVPNKVTFTPESDATNHRSCRIVTELDGTFFDIQGARGNFTINATAGQPLEVNFEMMGKPATKTGLVLDPVHTAAELEDVSNWATWGGGSSDNPLFQCANGQIVVNGGSTLSAGDFVMKSATFNKGNTVEPRTDANDCESVREYSIADSAPTLELVIEMSQDVNNWIQAGDLLNPWSSWRTSNTHAVSFSHARGSTAPNQGGKSGGTSEDAQVDFLFPQCQLSNVQTSDGEAGVRNVTLTYDVIHQSTDDGEFTITWWGTIP